MTFLLALFPTAPMHEVNVYPLKYEYQISLCETNPLGSCKTGIPREVVVGEGDSCQMGLLLEDRVKGAATLLAPAQYYGSFACVGLTGCVWHCRLCETHVRTELCVKANMVGGLVTLKKFNKTFCIFSRGASPLTLPY